MNNLTNKERMTQLIDSFEKKGEIYIGGKQEPWDKTMVGEECKRLRKLALEKSNMFFKESYQSNYSTSAPYQTGQGKTVNSIADDFYQDTKSTGLKTSRVPLQAEEGLEIALKRTLKSGAPINNISFYDEVNWHLMSLGFPAKLPIDIKSAIATLLDKI